MEDTDVIIAGLGAMGSASAYQLSRRGLSVRGFDRFTPPHNQGSSHGRTRIIREAYFEHPVYVPLVQRAYELWFEVEKQTGRTLLCQTGGLTLGAPSGAVFPGAKRSAEEHGLPHEILSGQEITRRFPAIKPAPEMMAVWEPRAGFLYPEACIDAHLQLAKKQRAIIHTEEYVVSWRETSGAILVTTNRGE